MHLLAKKVLWVFACLILPASSLRTARTQDGQPHGEIASREPGKLLFVSPVGGNQNSIEQTTLNVAHLRKTYPGSVDVLLFHYDHRRDLWMTASPAWYRLNVQNSSQKAGRKFGLLRQFIANYSMIEQYEWVWAVDEDFDITAVDIPLMMRHANETGSYIVTPSVGFPKQKMKPTAKHDNMNWCYGGEDACVFQASHPECKYRHANFIELMLPMFRPTALWKILTECDHCIHEGSEWGLDLVWCNLIGKAFHMKRLLSCAILDQVQAIKLNWHTLKKNYTVNAMAYNDVMKNHADLEGQPFKSECEALEG